ncbi:MAG: Unknown protein [uncultured Aureispira sp.]|uniref:Lipoprotein n=1 Tax=uncultured Aureispira sp. TaxID=1331704 RepID=A0A6S6U304_9BACT|nr:MAG: Unknown protein [uncultured Aureispira sp.]
MTINAIKSLLVLVVFSSLLFVGCKEEVIPDPVVDPLPFDDISELFETQAPAAQSFSITTNTTQTITGAEGTKITFYANSFVDGQGNIVTGQVDFELKEIYAKGDMLWSDRMTVASNSELLESGGEFSLKATSAGQEVFLNRDFFMEVPISSATSDPFAMELFTSTESDSTWTPADSTFVGIDSLTNSYQFNYDSLTWINCDYFSSATNTTRGFSVAPALSSGVNLTDVRAYVVFDNINSIASLYYNSATNAFECSYNLPIGEPVTVVIVGMDISQLYLGTLSTSITAVTSPLQVTMNPVTQAQLQTAIDNL